MGLLSLNLMATVCSTPPLKAYSTFNNDSIMVTPEIIEYFSDEEKSKHKLDKNGSTQRATMSYAYMSFKYKDFAPPYNRMYQEEIRRMSYSISMM